MKTKHLMLDLETFGTKPNSVIISLSAVVFDNEFNIIDEFTQNIDVQQSLNLGFTQDEQTLKWWSEQSEDALSLSTENALSVKSVLLSFYGFVVKNDIDYIYGNSVSFDCVLLKCYYDKFNHDVPWDFWQERCFRTYKSTFIFSDVEFEGVPHYGIDDCKHQINQLKQICKENNFNV